MRFADARFKASIMIKAVLTGHSKGLGLGIAQSLLARGYPVLGLSRSIHAELQKQFPTLLQQLPVDLAEHAALQELLVGEALPEFMANATQLLLINNAGLVSPIGLQQTRAVLADVVAMHGWMYALCEPVVTDALAADTLPPTTDIATAVTLLSALLHDDAPRRDSERIIFTSPVLNGGKL